MSRHIPRIHPFALGYVGAALLVGFVGGGMLGLKLWLVGSVWTICALVGTLVCRWWPGLNGAWWKLYLIAIVANPAVLAAAAWSISYYDCLIGDLNGWDCLFAIYGPYAVAGGLPMPLVGLALRWMVRRRSPGPAGCE